MKLTKTLISALSAVSIATLVPIITSCNKGGSSQYDGIIVTEAQWKEAFEYFKNIDITHNFTCESLQTAPTAGSNLLKVENYKEHAKVVVGQSVQNTFFKNNDDRDKTQLWDGEKWTLAGYATPSVNIAASVYNLGTTLSLSQFTYSNGKYIYTKDNTTIAFVFMKDGSKIRLKLWEHIAPSQHATMTFSDYNSTKIDNFPGNSKKINIK